MSRFKKVATAWHCIFIIAVTNVGHSQGTNQASDAGSANETRRLAALAKEKHLVVPKNAERVNYSNWSGGVAVGVSYFVREPYPAKMTLAGIQENLAKAKWMPLEIDWADPNLYLSRHKGKGWVKSEGPDGSETADWFEQWRSPDGEVVIYILEYQSGKGRKDGMDRVTVLGNWYSRDEAAKIKGKFPKEPGPPS